ncbi:hypothetical protein BGZ83_005330 [Gryganskiella cystojenkinii]|nr:hypothetical protein BGZ83_005330 [Gryganskiella cystojenkinii]
MLRDLMIETVEIMKYRLLKLLEEHAAIIAETENSDNKKVQVSEETAEDICEQYKPACGDKTLTECDTQGMIVDRDETFDGVGHSSELNYDVSEEITPMEYGEETATSL